MAKEISVDVSRREKPRQRAWEKGLSKKARLALAALAGIVSIEGLGAVIREQFNEQRVSSQTVKADLTWPWDITRSVIEDVQKLLNKKTVVAPENPFPYKLNASSFTPTTQEQAIQEIKNTNMADVENHTIKMFLPIDKETLDVSPNSKYDQVQKAIIPSYLDEALRKQLETVKNSVQMDGLPDGKIVKWSLPSKGKLRVISIAGQEKGGGSDIYIPSYSSVRIDFQENGKQLAIIISVLGGEPQFDPSQASWESNGVEIEFWQPLFKISETNSVGGKALPGEKGQIIINAFYIQEDPPIRFPMSVPKLPIPLRIDFLNEVVVE